VTSEEETRASFGEALAAHLEWMREIGEQVPERRGHHAQRLFARRVDGRAGTLRVDHVVRAGLGPPALIVTPTIAMPTELVGTRVSIDGVAVPILYTSATPVTALVPEAAAARAGPVGMPVERAAPSSPLMP
jgi:hypothetical protein